MGLPPMTSSWSPLSSLTCLRIASVAIAIREDDLHTGLPRRARLIPLDIAARFDDGGDGLPFRFGLSRSGSAGNTLRVVSLFPCSTAGFLDAFRLQPAIAVTRNRQATAWIRSMTYPSFHDCHMVTQAVTMAPRSGLMC